jgi:hypothetical protein
MTLSNHTKPLSDIFLRVKGELNLLEMAISEKEKYKVFEHRICLNQLLSEFRTSLELGDSLFISYKIHNVSTILLERAKTTLYNASHYLSQSLLNQ